jgi:hypothetical protein
MNPNTKCAVASVSAGVLTPVSLIALSWLTAQNFRAEGPDTTLSRMFISPIEWLSMFFARVFNISGWTLFCLTAAVLILALACLYYLIIRLVLVPLLHARKRKSLNHEIDVV